MFKRTSQAVLVAAGVLGVTESALAEDWDPDSEAQNYADAWVRFDADRVGSEFWLGTTIPIGALNLAANAIISQQNPEAVDPKTEPVLTARLGETARRPALRVELGPTFATGGLFLLPKVGLGYDFERETIAPLVPQLMTILQGGPLYVESWLQFFLNDMFDAGAQDSFYTQDILAVALDNHWAFGAQFELTARLNTPAGRAPSVRTGQSNATLRSLAVGPRVIWSPIEEVTFGIFAGYESQKIARPSDDDFLTGRFTASVFW